MPKVVYSDSVLKDVYKLIEKNEYITYLEIEDRLLPQKINANSVVKRLQRMGCVEIERVSDGLSGKIKGSRKVCVKAPE